MTLTRLVTSGIVVLGLSVGGANAAGTVCLISADACQDIQSGKNKSLRQKLSAPKHATDVMAANIIYSTFNKLQSEANGCKSSEKVTLDGFKPVFVLGSGKDKRALLARSATECAWIRVR